MLGGCVGLAKVENFCARCYFVPSTQEVENAVAIKKWTRLLWKGECSILNCWKFFGVEKLTVDVQNLIHGASSDGKSDQLEARFQLQPLIEIPTRRQ